MYENWGENKYNQGCSFHQVLADKLKESEEAQKVLQKDCETYKKVLAETVRWCSVSVPVDNAIEASWGLLN